MIKFQHLAVDGRNIIVVSYGDRECGRLTFDDGDEFKQWAGVVDGGFTLHEMLALRTARRILREVASHRKLGDDGYHDSVVDLARRWMELYGG